MKSLDLEINKKSFNIIFIICIVFVVCLIILYYALMLIYVKYEKDDSTIETKENMNTHMDIINAGMLCEISGWAYKEDEELKLIKASFILKDVTTGEMIKLKTTCESNENLPVEYINSELHSRFLSFGLSGRYDIYVLYESDGNNLLVNTDRYIEI